MRSPLAACTNFDTELLPKTPTWENNDAALLPAEICAHPGKNYPLSPRRYTPVTRTAREISGITTVTAAMSL